MNDYSLNKTDIAKEKEKGVLTTALRGSCFDERRRRIGRFCSNCYFCFCLCHSRGADYYRHIVDVYLQSKNFHGV